MPRGQRSSLSLVPNSWLRHFQLGIIDIPKLVPVGNTAGGHIYKANRFCKSRISPSPKVSSSCWILHSSLWLTTQTPETSPTGKLHYSSLRTDPGWFTYKAPRRRFRTSPPRAGRLATVTVASPAWMLTSRCVLLRRYEGHKQLLIWIIRGILLPRVDRLQEVPSSQAAKRLEKLVRKEARRKLEAL